MRMLKNIINLSNSKNLLFIKLKHVLLLPVVSVVLTSIIFLGGQRIFVYACYNRQILKEVVMEEHEYTNIPPSPVIELAMVLPVLLLIST